MNKSQEKQILKHADNLAVIFPNAKKQGIDLCKALLRIENKLHSWQTAQCNGDLGGILSLKTLDECELDSEPWEAMERAILALEAKQLVKVNKLLGNTLVPVVINGDCRGYTLKIKSEYIKENNLPIYTDMGGYGIIAPTFN